VPKKILLLDVSHLFFRAFFAIPKTLADREGNPINAVFGVSSMILSLMESEKPDYIFGAKDEKGPTQRHELIEDYKGHRPEMPLELVSQLPKIFEIFEAFGIPCFSEQAFEADDFLASIAERYRGDERYEVEIVSGDHDIFQLVGDNVYVGLPQNGDKKPLHLDREGVFNKIGVYPEQVPDYKSMAGDSSDNLKGIEGIGPKTAAKLLQEYGTIEKILKNAESILGKVGERLQTNKDIALLTKKLATLHRDISVPNFYLDQGSVKNTSEQKLNAFFRSYSFHSLLNRMPKIFGNTTDVESSKREDELWQAFEEAKQGKLGELKEKSGDDQMSLF
jgi:DNA polymerase-1